MKFTHRQHEIIKAFSKVPRYDPHDLCFLLRLCGVDMWNMGAISDETMARIDTLGNEIAEEIDRRKA